MSFLKLHRRKKKELAETSAGRLIATGLLRFDAHIRARAASQW